MPVINGRDSDGPYYRWGQTGHKYYYISGHKRSREIAKGKAAAQGRAIHANRGY